MIRSLIILVGILFVSGCKEQLVPSSHLGLVPLPQSVVLSEGSITLTKANQDLLATRVIENNNQVTFAQEPSMGKEVYRLTLSKEGIEVLGGSELALQHGITTLLQLKTLDGVLPLGVIKDEPAYPYRGLMVDLSRNWHDIPTLEQLIELCAWYKINYLHLHLTDDALFTFSSEAFPKLASEKHYTAEEIAALNEFAIRRGVTLVPEVDIPGHSSGFIRAMPELFGIADVSKNSYTVNMGKEEVYEALEVLFAEIIQAFPNSPYVHIGGDEVFTEGFAEDPHVIAYMKEYQLEDLDELYLHFLVRMTSIIKKLGKTPMLWSGFEAHEKVGIPKDVIVMSWKPSDYLPAALLDNGYTLINASWQPLYVVNNRKWSPEEIYKWNPTVWKGFATPTESDGHVVSNTTNIEGGSMSVWEQNQFKAFASLEERLPAMAERLWRDTVFSYTHFEHRLTRTKAELKSKLFPFEFYTNGLSFPASTEPNFREDMWFTDTLKLTPLTTIKNGSVRYSLADSLPAAQSPILPSGFPITESTRFSAQLFVGDTPKGQPILKEYRLVPLTFEVAGLVNDLLPRSWEKHKFIDSLTVKIVQHRSGRIRYTLDGSSPTNESLLYEGPIISQDSHYLRARLFDENEEPIGGERWEEYERLQLETSLTTNKPVTTSNVYEAGIPEVINDGKITRWDHWGAHTNGNNWVIIDLEKPTEIGAFKTYTFWDGYRYYEYTISVSNDNMEWELVVDRSKNREISTAQGTLDNVSPVSARYVKLQLLRNSANPGLHLVEFHAFAPDKNE